MNSLFKEPPSMIQELDRKIYDEVKASYTRGVHVATIFGISGFFMLLVINLLGLAQLWLQCIFVGTIAVYGSLITILLQKGRIGGEKIYTLLLFPLLLPTLFFIVANCIAPEDTFVYLCGPFSYAYFIMIIISGFVFSYRFSVITGLISSLGYFLAYLLAMKNLQSFPHPETEAYRTALSPFTFCARSLLMLFGGVLVGALSNCARRFIQRIFREEQDKLNIVTTFGMIVDPRVRDLMIEKKIELGGETRETTVLFADIRGFTTFSQHMPPRELFLFMKEYFDLMNAEITGEEGTIMEYVGDEIMVLFGAPLPIEDHAARAVKAALRMQDALKRRNPIWQKENKPVLNIGIGIHTGSMLVGNIGSSERYKYGAMGDNVNLASRLQSLTKDYGLPVIASEDTVKQCGDAFFMRKLDNVVVKGRTAEVAICEVIASSVEPLSTERSAFMKAYEEALSQYNEGNRNRALALFRRCHALSPGDNATRLHIERLEQLGTQQQELP